MRSFVAFSLMTLILGLVGCSGSSAPAVDTASSDSQNADQGVDAPTLPDITVLADTPSLDEGSKVDTTVVDMGNEVVEPDVTVQPSLPAQGILQLRIKHNMAETGCLELGNCQVEMAVPSPETPAWVEALTQYGNMPVLHWDRPMPWIAFSEDPIGDPVEFYNARMPTELRDFVDAYAAAFSLGGGYLALTPISGTRKAVKPHYVVGGEAPVGEDCDSMEPSQVFSVDLQGNAEPQEFTLGSTYLNFVRYMYTRLQPAYLALGIEVNVYEDHCKEHPGAFEDFVSLYQWVYDNLREDGLQIPIFATFTLVELMGFDENNCQGPGDFAACGSPRPDLEIPDPTDCFPVNRSSVDALDEGDRLDILAFSYYPDLLRSNVESDAMIVQSGDSNGDGPCVGMIHLADVPDPLEHLDLLGWDKPMAFAEIGAQSCPVPVYFPAPLPTDTPLVMVLPGSPNRQAHYINTILETATARQMPFVVNAFLNDFRPILPFVAREELLPASVVALFNAFSCMGLRDDQSNGKTGLPWGFP